MEPKSKPRNLRLIIALVVLALAIVFGGLGYYLAQMDDTDSEVADTIATPTVASSTAPTATAPATPAPIATATPTPDATATWKTYTNTKHTYSIKYPDTDKWKYYTNEPDDGKFVGFCRSDVCQDARHRVNVSTDSVATVVANISQYNTAQKNYAKKDITFNGMAATQITWTVVIDEADSLDLKYIVLSKGGKTYEISGTVKDYLVPKDSNFDQLLATFKFN